MTTRIDSMFAQRRAENRAALIFYVTAGFPDLATTETVIDALVRAGADLIELGVPFSDPIADGPTIQHASYVALEHGTTVPQILELMGRIRAKHAELPVLFFSAYNPILHMGDEAFCQAAQAAGADGLLVPDLPPEEAGDLRAAADRHALNLVFLTAPTTTAARGKMICEASSGFIYTISLKGVTGARADLPPDLEPRVRALKAGTDKPVAVGFGVSEPAHAAAISRFADGVIVGSALIKLIDTTPAAQLGAAVEAYARSLVDAARDARRGAAVNG